MLLSKLRIHEVEKISSSFGVPLVDTSLISLNACGINSCMQYKRIRFKLGVGKENFCLGPPNNILNSPFYMSFDKMHINGHVVGKSYFEEILETSGYAKETIETFLEFKNLFQKFFYMSYFFGLEIGFGSFSSPNIINLPADILWKVKR